MTEPVRLAKRLAEMIPCSRSQAEQYIEGGWVRVNGRVEESPQHRVTTERIELDPHATLLDSVPMTVLLHKPPGFDWGDGARPAGELLTEAGRSHGGRNAVRLLKRHLKDHVCVTPLEPGASGLLVFTQDLSVQRKLWDDALWVENELIVDVKGEVGENTLRLLNRPLLRNDRPVLTAKVALSKQTEATTGLRFAVKGGQPGAIAIVCEHAGLQILGIKRIRVGRVPMADLAVGQWRFLTEHERF
jgi:23S rRNA pseudouridine2604 synthase